MADPVAAFVTAGAGDIDSLPNHPTASDWSYHLHGPPSIHEGFDTLDVFRTLVFDWEQVWGDDASWTGAGLEFAMLLPIGRPGRVTRLGHAVDGIDDAIDAVRVADVIEGADVAKVLEALDDAGALRYIELFDPNASSSSVLQGGLLAHEGAGRGHTVARHVGRTPEQLAARAAEDGLDVVSTFSSLQHAERAVAGALRSEARQVAAWLESSRKGTTISGIVSESAGIVLDVSVSEIKAPSTVVVVLRRDASMPMGFRVQSAFLS